MSLWQKSKLARDPGLLEGGHLPHDLHPGLDQPHGQGRTGPFTEAQVQVPAPTVSPTVGAVTVDPVRTSAQATASLSDDRLRIGVEVVEGPCPAEPPADAAWGDAVENPPGTFTFFPEGEGTGAQCAMFAAIDDGSQHGPVVMRPFTMPG